MPDTPEAALLALRTYYKFKYPDAGPLEMWTADALFKRGIREGTADVGVGDLGLFDLPRERLVAAQEMLRNELPRLTPGMGVGTSPPPVVRAPGETPPPQAFPPATTEPSPVATTELPPVTEAPGEAPPEAGTIDWTDPNTGERHVLYPQWGWTVVYDQAGRRLHMYKNTPEQVAEAIRTEGKTIGEQGMSEEEAWAAAKRAEALTGELFTIRWNSTTQQFEPVAKSVTARNQWVTDPATGDQVLKNLDTGEEIDRMPAAAAEKKPDIVILRTETGPGGYERDVYGYVDPETGKEVIVSYSGYRKPTTAPKPTERLLRTETGPGGYLLDRYGYVDPETGLEVITRTVSRTPFEDPGVQRDWLAQQQAARLAAEAEWRRMQQAEWAAQRRYEEEQAALAAQQQRQEFLAGLQAAPRSWIEYWQYTHRGGAPLTQEQLLSQPLERGRGLPPAPSWMEKIPVSYGQFKLPSGQQWQRLQPSEREAYKGLTDWMRIPEMDIRGRMSRLWPQWASKPGAAGPAYQRG